MVICCRYEKIFLKNILKLFEGYYHSASDQQQNPLEKEYFLLTRYVLTVGGEMTWDCYEFYVSF